MLTFPARLRAKTVVVVNEYYGPGRFSPGHMNLSFYRYGRPEGTFGQNQAGFDTKGAWHNARKIPWFTGPGGVFVEPNDRSQPHFYIVSEANYNSMLSYARSRAETTTKSNTHYWLFGQNCADFIRDVFYHSNLPEPVRNVYGQVKDQSEWVAVYAGFSYHILTFPTLPGANDPTDSAYSRLAAAR